jgi:hypothetical protein
VKGLAPVRFLLPALLVALAVGCASVLGADFDRELDPSVGQPGIDASETGDASEAEGGDGDGGARDGTTKPTSDGGGGDGGMENFFTAGLTESVQDVFTNGNEVFWTTLDNLGFNPTRVTLYARSVDGSNQRVVASPPTSGNAGGIGRCFTLTGAGTSVWLASSADQSTGTISSTTGASLVDVVTNEDQPCVLAILQGKPYWWHATSSLLRTSNGSGSAKTVSSAFLAEALAADATSLFAGVTVYFDGSGVSRAIVRLDIQGDGGAAIVPLAKDSTGLLGGLSLSSGHVFWADTLSGSVRSVAKTGGTPVTVAGGTGRPRFVAYRDQFVYFTTDASDERDVGTVARIAVSNGVGVGAVAPLATKRDVPRRITVDATHVYWVEGGKRIQRIRIDGK